MFFIFFKLYSYVCSGTMRYSLHKQASASLKSGLDLREIVKLPDNEDEDDWIAVHGENDKN
jgi:hypothetical protein